MKIIIESARMPRDIEGLVRTYPCLADFGFDIHKRADSASIVVKTADGNERRIEFSSSAVYTPYVELNTMDDLARMERAIGKNLLFSTDFISFSDGFDGIIRIMDETK